MMVPVKAATLDSVQSVFDLTPSWRQEIEHFFSAAVAFEAKDLKLLGWCDQHAASTMLLASLASAGS